MRAKGTDELIVKMYSVRIFHESPYATTEHFMLSKLLRFRNLVLRVQLFIRPVSKLFAKDAKWNQNKLQRKALKPL